MINHAITFLVLAHPGRPR